MHLASLWWDLIVQLPYFLVDKMLSRCFNSFNFPTDLFHEDAQAVARLWVYVLSAHVQLESLKALAKDPSSYSISSLNY